MMPSTPKVVAVLVTHEARHTLLSHYERYDLVTSSGGKVLAKRRLDDRQASEWLAMCRSCGGEVRAWVSS